MSEYQNIQNIFAKFYTPNWSGKCFTTKNVKIRFRRCMYILKELNDEETVRTFY